MKSVIWFVIGIAVLGYVGRGDLETARLEQASNVCQSQTAYSVPTFQQCIANQLEKNGDR